MPKTGRSSFVAVDTVLYGEAGRISPPASLGEEERAAFLDLISSCPRDQFLASDIETLVAWAECTCIRRRAYRQMLITGEIDEDGKVTAAFSVHQQAVKSLTALSRALRLNPMSRRQQPPRQQVKTSYYDRLEIEMEVERQREDD